MPDEMIPDRQVNPMMKGIGGDLTPRILRIIAETQRRSSQVTIDSSFEELGIDSMVA